MLLDQITIFTKGDRKLVKKRYGNIMGILKWMLAEFPFVQIHYPFENDPWRRMSREYFFLTSPLRSFKTPTVVEYNPHELYIVREYIDGREILVNESDARELGIRLAKLHEEAFCLGDTKPSNFLMSLDGNLYVLDAEQAVSNCYDESFMAWDLLFHLYVVNLKNIGALNVDMESYTRVLLGSYFENSSYTFKTRDVRPLLSFFSLIHPLFGLKIVKEFSAFMR